MAKRQAKQKQKQKQTQRQQVVVNVGASGSGRGRKRQNKAPVSSSARARLGQAPVVYVHTSTASFPVRALERNYSDRVAAPVYTGSIIPPVSPPPPPAPVPPPPPPPGPPPPGASRPPVPPRASPGTSPSARPVATPPGGVRLFPPPSVMGARPEGARDPDLTRDYFDRLTAFGRRMTELTVESVGRHTGHMHDDMIERSGRILDEIRGAEERRRADSEHWLGAMLSAMGTVGKEAAREVMENMATGDPSLTKPGGAGSLEQLPEGAAAAAGSSLAQLRRTWLSSRRHQEFRERGGYPAYSSVQQVPKKRFEQEYDALFAGIPEQERELAVSRSLAAMQEGGQQLQRRHLPRGWVPPLQDDQPQRVAASGDMPVQQVRFAEVRRLAGPPPLESQGPPLAFATPARGPPQYTEQPWSSPVQGPPDVKEEMEDE